MPGETWPEAAAAFLALWLMMMAAMMLPSLAPVLWRVRQSVASRGTDRRMVLTAMVGSGYFVVWTALGLAVFPTGVALTSLTARLPPVARVAPTAAGLLVLLAGVLQFTPWKARHLVCFAEAAGSSRPPISSASGAWRHGLRLGLHCATSSAGLMATLLVFGMMNLRLMTAVTVAITAERLSPSPLRTARAIGVITLALGAVVIARAAGG